MDMNRTKYLDVFIEESKEYLQDLNLAILQLEADPENSSVINEIFRLAHTLKGMAGTMGFEKMAGVTHKLEDILQEVRSNATKADESLVDMLFKALDFLEESVEEISQTGNEGDIVCNLFEDLDGQEIQLNSYEKKLISTAYDLGMQAYRITVNLSKTCIMKSARAFVIFNCLEKFGEIIKSIPIVQDIEDEKFEDEFTVVIISKFDKNSILKEVSNISEVEKVTITEEDLQKHSSARLSENKKETPSRESVPEGNTKDNNKSNMLSSKPRKIGKTIRVDIDRLDTLLNLVSELIIQKTRLTDLGTRDNLSKYNETLEQLDRITSDLHDAVMKVRMVPIETVFNRFPRMIRDISKELGKEVELKISGQDTELDRTIIDEIGEPLIHLLRNSVDHGLECVETRQKLGKPAKGQINLRAFQDGGYVIIEVEDDGQGFNLKKIKEKALEKNLINKENINTLTEQGVIELLFTPGFSTTNEITDISGRGVGLDVVRTKIQSLGGTIDVATQQGKGSKFTIRLPLTLALMKALMVYIGKERYAIKMSSIQQIIEIIPKDIRMIQQQEAILMNEALIPIIRMNRLLDIPSENNSNNHYTVVVIRNGKQLVGLMVDSIIGQLEVVQRPLGKYLSSVKIANSATILGDGKVALILNENYLMQ
jgi:two-component system chemotaxis sensor kinase CheA